MSPTSALAYKIISVLKENQQIKDGVTIPFLVGIYHQKYSVNLFSPECIKIIIQDIIDHSQGHKFFLSTCNNIGEYVLSILNEADEGDRQITRPYSTYSHLSNDQNIPVLYFEEDFDISDPTINNVSQYLYDKYHQFIQDELFSKIDGQWVHYSKQEEEIIRSIL